MVTVKLVPNGDGTYKPSTIADVLTLNSFGFYDRVATDNRTIEEWKQDRGYLNLDGIVKMLIPI